LRQSHPPNILGVVGGDGCGFRGGPAHHLEVGGREGGREVGKKECFERWWRKEEGRGRTKRARATPLQREDRHERGREGERAHRRKRTWEMTKWYVVDGISGHEAPGVGRRRTRREGGREGRRTPTQKHTEEGGREGGRAYLGDNKVVLDRTHVIVVDGISGHKAPGVELQDGVVQGRLFHQLTGCGLQHFLADFHAGEGGREGGEEVSD